MLIYAENTSLRLQYTCRFIFEEILKIPFNLTTHRQSFSAEPGPKINYSHADLPGSYTITPRNLLFEKGITPQQIDLTGTGREAVLFRNETGDHPFDIFSACFYLLTCYEEYLPHEKDQYGRYAHENSIAYQHGFLNIPLVNIWIGHLAENLKSYFPEMLFSRTEFRFVPTYDIDMAWSYREKGLLRNAAGFLVRPEFRRLAVLAGWKKDPFDSFEFLFELHRRFFVKPIYFFLVAQRTGVYDKNILPSNKAMEKLIIAHAKEYPVGLHPSWRAFSDQQILSEEKEILEKIIQQKVTVARRHYIKMTLPQSYRESISAGLTNEYSMGYGSINGFRASVASAYYWFDIEEEKITTLRVHPFCFMDANCHYEEKFSPEDSYDQLMHYYRVCREVNGSLVTIFHNNFLGTDKRFRGWRELYTKFISQLPGSAPNVS